MSEPSRAPAGAPCADVGALVVVDGQPGVLRVERILADGRARCFSYVDGSFVVVDAAALRACPPGTPAGR